MSNDDILAPAKQAASDLKRALAQNDADALGPGIVLGVKDGDKATNLPMIGVRKPPTTKITKAKFEEHLQDASRAWEGAANDALDRATAILKSAADANWRNVYGSILAVGGALLGPIAPWTSAMAWTMSVFVNDIDQSRGASQLNLEGFRSAYLDTVQKVQKKFLEDRPRLADELVKAHAVFNWTANEARENALLKVLSVDAVRKSNGGVVDVDETRLRASIELGLLLDFASAAVDSGRLSIPYVYAVMGISVSDMTRSTDTGSVAKTPDEWSYKITSFKLQVLDLPDYDPRVKSLLSRLRLYLSLYTRTVPLSVTFSAGDRNMHYLTHTAVWQPDSGPTPLGDGVVVSGPGLLTLKSPGVPGSGPSKATVETREFDSLPGAVADAAKAFVNDTSTSSHFYAFPTYDFKQRLGLAMMHTAWKGPFPDLGY